MRCLYCQTTDGPFHLDHVVPRSRGGPDAPSNLVTACERCNLSKSDRLPSEWNAPAADPIVAEIEARIAAAMGVRFRRRNRPEGDATPCFFCGGALDAASAVLIFADTETGAGATPVSVRYLPDGGRDSVFAFDWPGMGEHHVRAGQWRGAETVGLVAHGGCGRELIDGYWIHASRLRDPALFRHVWSKSWWCTATARAWQDAKEVFCQ